MSLLDLLLPQQPGPGGEQDRIYGVVTGIVEEIQDPLKQGRIQVNFPWLAGDAAGVPIEQGEKSAHSYWARLAMPMAGKNRGTWFVPEPGDEVAVVFEHGDVDRPIVIGTLWNKDDTPPQNTSDDPDNDTRAIYSRSGHKIILNDSKDSPLIQIVDNTGKNSIKIDTANNAMEIKVAQNLTIDAGGDITIKATGKIQIQATQDLSLETQNNFEAKATASGSLESTGSLTVKSNSTVSVEGSAQAELKGAMVSVNGSATTTVKGGIVMIN